MPLPSALVRAHLNFLPDETADDAILTHFTRWAEAWVESYTGLPFDADSPLMVDAALLLVAYRYENREAVTFSSPYQLPFGVIDSLSGIKRQVVGYVPEPEAATNG
ncbi:MAG TPA: head-tail connector protein [Paracoccus sp. (in: a-proteobacteria)]|uniref:head-tail connector protein n=1 Tax=Paracoccus sp. TaxID=267 RepID=UPI002BD5D5E2|nr:head-tail connector protein [Paracoccus sp. (in: a-proteobacteria)]HWL56536.1 head-tail connector protein [Paracoccus sp. (in: a-proteobacteria)]